MAQINNLRQIYASVRQYFYLRKAQADIHNNRVDPMDWQAIALPPTGKPAIVYVPIPKAANTSIRLSFCDTLGIDPSSIENIHSDKRIPKQSLKQTMSLIDRNTYCFTAVRHPADRIRSAYQNKIIDQKQSFGPTRRLGILKTDSFETFLKRIGSVPANTLDSHFRPQTLLLYYALDHPGFQIIKTGDLSTAWPDICKEFSKRGLRQPSNHLGKKNPSSGSKKYKFSEPERALIQKIYADDFEKFEFDW